jgi:ABC-type branched-subunit amino acid transport system substrate-binding protein
VASRVLARGRAGCAWALLAVAIAGCTSNGSGSSAVTVTGKTLTIYLSDAPTSQPLLARDVLAAEQLAFKQGQPTLDGYTVQTKVVSGKISDQARTVIQDKTAIAYLGEVIPGSSADSLGITNALDLLQVSPTDNALELTQASPVVSGSPDRYYESKSSYNQTFARLVATSAHEARALVQEMRTRGVTKLYVTNDGGSYGAAIANVVKQDAAGSISVVGSLSGADGAFYGGSSPPAGARFFNKAALSSPTMKLFGPSALDGPSLPDNLTPAAHNVFISAPGFLKQNLTPAGSKFVTDFTAAYGHTPVSQAIFGYEAMSAVLAVLRKAGTAANNRSTVVSDFLSLKNRQSVLGTYSMSASGDISIAPFVFSRIQQGKLVPFAQVQG